MLASLTHTHRLNTVCRNHLSTNGELRDPDNSRPCVCGVNSPHLPTTHLSLLRDLKEANLSMIYVCRVKSPHETTANLCLTKESLIPLQNSLEENKV